MPCNPVTLCRYLRIVWGYERFAGTAVIVLGAFRVLYGHPYEGEYVIDANWQLGFTAANFTGEPALSR
jgi:hypothetical protein